MHIALLSLPGVFYSNQLYISSHLGLCCLLHNHNACIENTHENDRKKHNRIFLGVAAIFVYKRTEIVWLTGDSIVLHEIRSRGWGRITHYSTTRTLRFSLHTS